MTDEPTMGEVIRRLDAIAGQLTDVVRELKDDRRLNAQTFVRQDVYTAQRRADHAVVADVAGDVIAVRKELGRHVDGQAEKQRADAAFRRQVFLGLALTGGGWLLTIALFIATFVLRP